MLGSDIFLISCHSQKLLVLRQLISRSIQIDYLINSNVQFNSLSYNTTPMKLLPMASFSNFRESSSFDARPPFLGSHSVADPSEPFVRYVRTQFTTCSLWKFLLQSSYCDVKHSFIWFTFVSCFAFLRHAFTNFWNFCLKFSNGEFHTFKTNLNYAFQRLRQ